MFTKHFQKIKGEGYLKGRIKWIIANKTTTSDLPTEPAIPPYMEMTRIVLMSYFTMGVLMSYFTMGVLMNFRLLMWYYLLNEFNVFEQNSMKIVS